MAGVWPGGQNGASGVVEGVGDRGLRRAPNAVQASETTGNPDVETIQKLYGCHMYGERVGYWGASGAAVGDGRIGPAVPGRLRGGSAARAARPWCSLGGRRARSTGGV